MRALSGNNISSWICFWWYCTKLMARLSTWIQPLAVQAITIIFVLGICEEMCWDIFVLNAKVSTLHWILGNPPVHISFPLKIDHSCTLCWCSRRQVSARSLRRRGAGYGKQNSLRQQNHGATRGTAELENGIQNAAMWGFLQCGMILNSRKSFAFFPW